jgi:hypothetical protein
MVAPRPTASLLGSSFVTGCRARGSQQLLTTGFDASVILDSLQFVVRIWRPLSLVSLGGAKLFLLTIVAAGLFHPDWAFSR